MRHLIILLTILFAAGTSSAQKILFAEKNGNNWDLFSLNLKDNKKERLTNHSLRDFQSDYSARNDQIVFDSYRDKNTRNIFILDRTAKKFHQLTFFKTRDGHPVWSNDGEQIAFQSSRTGDSEVFIMNRDGSDVQRITNSEGFDGIPKWSPQDDKLAFNTSRHGNPDVYLYDLKKQCEIRITTAPSADFIQDWSPANSRLLILSDRSGKNQLYTKTGDGTSLQIIKTPFEITHARFDREGKRIVFTAKTEKGINIFLMESDGSGLKQITNSDTEKRFPAFMDERSRKTP